MYRGTKPKPKSIKLVAGNPGKRPINEQEPVFSQTTTDVPESLSDDAAALWGRLAVNLDANGLLTEASRELLTIYCDLVANYWERRAKGEMPSMAHVARIQAIAGEFGFTPSAASRIIAPNKAKADGKQRFFG